MPCSHLPETMAKATASPGGIRDRGVLSLAVSEEIIILFFFYRIQKFCHTPVRLISHWTSESSHLMLLNIFRCLSLNLLPTPAENENISYNTQTLPGACRYSQFNNKYRDRHWVMRVLRESCSPSPLYWFRSQFLPPARSAPALVGRAVAHSQLHTQQRSQPVWSASL